jgi:hypothetical protein
MLNVFSAPMKKVYPLSILVGFEWCILMKVPNTLPISYMKNCLSGLVYIMYIVYYENYHTNLKRWEGSWYDCLL